MARSLRLAITGALFAAAAGLAIFTAMAFVASSPPTVDFASGHQSGQPVNLTVQTVGSIGYGPHPTWVSYLVQAPGGQWVHSTIWQLPADTQINVTIYQYDSGSPLRNQLWGGVTGTQGGYMLLNGKKTTLIDSNAGNGIGHTFTVPSLDINVPLYANSSSANLCPAAPCTTSSPHNVVTFSFRTPGPGEYPFQCFIPCGLGFLFGNGGPMQTLGYMGGFLKVVAA